MIRGSWFVVRVVQAVPAHVGDAKGRVIGRQHTHLALEPAKALVGAVLVPARKQHLHADANAEEGLFLFEYGVFERGARAGQGAEARHAIRKSTDARQHDMRGLTQRRGIGDDLERCPFGQLAHEGFADGVKISRAAVDDGDVGHAAHSW